MTICWCCGWDRAAEDLADAITHTSKMMCQDLIEGPIEDFSYALSESLGQDLSKDQDGFGRQDELLQALLKCSEMSDVYEAGLALRDFLIERLEKHCEGEAEARILQEQKDLKLDRAGV